MWIHLLLYWCEWMMHVTKCELMHVPTTTYILMHVHVSPEIGRDQPILGFTVRAERDQQADSAATRAVVSI